MGKIKTMFNYSIATQIMGGKVGITPADIMQVFGYLPGHTTIDDIKLMQPMVSLFIQYEVEATNDTFPDGTQIIVKYKREACQDDKGVLKQFNIFDGIDIVYPQGLQVAPVSPPAIHSSPMQIGSSQPANTSGIINFPPGLTFDLTSKCSCGSAKVGSPKHSTWCDVANDDLSILN